MAAPVWSDLHSQFHRALGQSSILPRGGKLLVALSGGQDSVCLTQLLLDLQPRWGWQLAIGHCDHGWRADRDIADRVRMLAGGWGLPLYCWRAQQLPETEAAARAWRYQALAQMAATKAFTHVVTAHTQSDVAETLLLNLVRGAGAVGLSSLRPERPLGPELRLVRPLLGISRSATATFCHQRRLPLWEDAYNHDQRYGRNRVRQWLADLTTAFHPQVGAHLAQTAQILGAESDYLQQLAETAYQEADLGAGRLDRRVLQPLPLALRRRVLRCFCQAHQVSLSFRAIEDLVALIDGTTGDGSSSLSSAGGVVGVVVVGPELHLLPRP